MKHKADLIMDAVETALSGISAIPGGCKRARSYPHEDDMLPALSVYVGSDDPTALESSGFTHLDSLLTVRVQVAVKGKAEEIDAELLRIRRDVTVAMMADHTLGLAFVVDTTEGAAQEPQTESEGRQLVFWQELTYQVHYRRSRTDPAQ